MISARGGLFETLMIVASELEVIGFLTAQRAVTSFFYTNACKGRCRTMFAETSGEHCQCAESGEHAR
jgi:hypothetical protein